MKAITIADDTPILPDVVANAIVTEVCNYFQNNRLSVVILFNEHADEELAIYLTERAETTYLANKMFQSLIRGKNGLDTLYSFMRHWAAGWVYRKINVHMPPDFCNGLPLPEVTVYDKPLHKAEMKRFLPLLQRVESDPELWTRLTEGLGIATLNAYRKCCE